MPNSAILVNDDPIRNLPCECTKINGGIETLYFNFGDIENPYDYDQFDLTAFMNKCWNLVAQGFYGFSETDTENFIVFGSSEYDMETFQFMINWKVLACENKVQIDNLGSLIEKVYQYISARPYVLETELNETENIIFSSVLKYQVKEFLKYVIEMFVRRVIINDVELLN